MSELKEWTASEIEEYDDARLELAEDGKIDCIRVYIKSEADKVIADLEESHKKEVEQLLIEIAELKDKLKVQTSNAEEAWKLKDSYHTSYAEAVKELYAKNKEIAELEDRIDEGDKDFEIAYHQNERLLQIVRHQKQKRCLAMAMWCAAQYNEWSAYYPTTITRKMKFLDKWEKRWLELAEKFKEAKEKNQDYNFLTIQFNHMDRYKKVLGDQIKKLIDET